MKPLRKAELLRSGKCSPRISRMARMARMFSRAGFPGQSHQKKRGHPERSIGTGEGGGPMRSEGSRGMPARCPVLLEHLSQTHGILRLRAAPPPPSRRSAANEPVPKNEVILNGASAWALAVGRRAVKNPVECLNNVRSCPNVLRELTGFFDSVPPRLRPRGTPLRMTSVLLVHPAPRITPACDAAQDDRDFDAMARDGILSPVPIRAIRGSSSV